MKRMKLDQSPLSARKVGIKAAKHGDLDRAGAVDRFHLRWLFHADPDAGRRKCAGIGLGPWETFWIFFYGFATYGNAGWMREQVCKYMCPYARFQSVMFDQDTLVITYDRERGRATWLACEKRRPQGKGPGGLRRLRHLRAGLPDGDRHPQRAAVRVHRLRRLHRRVRPGHGKGRLSEGADPLRHGQRHQGALHAGARRCGVYFVRAFSSTREYCGRSSSRPASRSTTGCR